MKTKKIISVILLAFVLINALQGIVKAVDIENAYIENLGQCEKHLQYKKAQTGQWSYIVTTMTGYRTNGILHYAYCLNVDKNGVGEEENYNVNVSEILSDEKIWRAITNGFPYKTPEELGVANEQDAFVATKQSVYSVLYDRDVDSFYRGGDERGVQIFNAIKNIVNIARNGTQTPTTTNLLTINKVGKFKEDIDDYYSQEYSVSTNVEISNYKITQITNFPEGSYIVGVDNNEKTEFLGEEHFKILVPKDKILNNFDGKIEIAGLAKTYPVFYGKSFDANLQDYALTYDAYTNANGETTLTVKCEKGQIKVIKISEDDNLITGEKAGTPIANVKFEVYDIKQNLVDEITTGKDGTAITKELVKGQYIIKEIETVENYELNVNDFLVEITSDGEIVEVEVKNKSKTPPPQEEPEKETQEEPKEEIKKLPVTGY